MSTISRETLLATLKTTLDTHPAVLAAWQGGAAAFNRIDDYSDIDLMVVVQEGASEVVHAAIEKDLKLLGELDFRMEMPRPAWHGLHQVFYRVAGGNPYHFLDIAVGSKEKVLALSYPPVHGKAVILLDKGDVFQPQGLDINAHMKAIEARLKYHRKGFEMFRHLTLKEFERANAIEAAQYYASFTLRPLLELLRIHHNPVRYDFSTRYIHYELPKDVIKRLEPLYFPADISDLRQKHAEASAWIQDLLQSIDLEVVRSDLEKAAKKK